MSHELNREKIRGELGIDPPENLIPAAKIHFPEDDIRQIQKEVGDILRTGQLTLGSRTRKFEEDFAGYVGAENALAVSSGTAALEIALRSLGVEGKNVIVPVNTFFASAAAVHHAGGKLTFADIDPATLSLEANKVEGLIDDNTAGIMVVHIGGWVTPEIEKLVSLCRERGIFLIEDAAHAHGSTFNGRQAGTFGDVGTFSFFPTKVMTSGEGGMIVTNREDIARDVEIFRDQGKASKAQNVHTHMGNAWRMSELHALVGGTQLKRLPEFIDQRQKIARVYDEGLSGVSSIKTFAPPDGSSANYYKYIAWLDEGVDRDTLKQRMRHEYGISLSGEVYATPLNAQPVFQGLYKGGPFPNAERDSRQQICLPISAVMTEDEARYVVAALKHIL